MTRANLPALRVEINKMADRRPLKQFKPSRNILLGRDKLQDDINIRQRSSIPNSLSIDKLCKDFVKDMEKKKFSLLH